MAGIIQERFLEAQTSIIGSMLIDDSCIGNVLTAVTAEDFQSGPHKTVFGCIKQLFTAGEPVDPVIVGGRLDKSYHNFLMQCMEVTPTSAHVMQYCEILRNDSRLLQLQDLGEQLRTVSDLDAARELSGHINRLMVEHSRLEVFTASDLATEFYKRMKSQKKPEYIPIGIKDIDDKTYIEPGDVIGIGAAPSTGKTAFALQWATEIAKKYRVGFYSLETNQSKAADRILARKAEISLGDIKKRLFPEDAWTRIAQACTSVASLKLEFIPAAGMTAADIMSTAISRRQQIIFVDYLQLVSGVSREQNRYSIVTDSSMTFHLSAQRNGIVVVLLSQLSRPQKEKGKYIPPDMHSFRESGQIEQDLDLALLMYLVNPDDYRSDRRIKIGKNKEGEKGVVDLSFDGRMQRFSPSQKAAFSEVRKMGQKAKMEQAQIRMEDQYAAMERAGKNYEVVQEETPFD